MNRFKVGGVPEHFNLPWKLAMEQGKFREHEIHLHWEDMTGGTGQMIRGLENKTLDIAILLTEGITKAILQGLDATIVQVYVTSPLSWGIHVPYNSSYQTALDIDKKVGAISRTGSGSHLMSYIMADELGWDTKELEFNVIGDIYGGLWALENNEAQFFLWEKYTTSPFVKQKKCRRVGDVVTPWPCFVIAVRNDILLEKKDSIATICSVIQKASKELEVNPSAIEMFAWRYNLSQDEVEAWFKDVEWNYDGKLDIQEFEKTVNYLHRLELISTEEKQHFEAKLFGKYFK